MTAETLHPAKVAHVARRSFLKFLERHPEAYQIVVEELSRNVTKSSKQLRTSVSQQQLAKSLRTCCSSGAKAAKPRQAGVHDSASR